jgi:hypothetical protein
LSVMTFMRNDPLKTIQKLIKERYSHAKAAFWAGSVPQNKSTEASFGMVLGPMRHLIGKFQIKLISIQTKTP